MPTLTPNRNYIKPNVGDPVDADIWGSELNDSLDLIDADVQAALDAGGAVPVGTVLDFAGSTAPADYLLCYGQAISRTTYADLFTAIGTNYGSGDGSTTFNVPDLRGRVAAGKDNMGGSAANRLTSPVAGSTLGASGGSESHTLSIGEIPSHTHTFVGNTGLAADGGGGTGQVNNQNQNTGSAGGGGAHNNTQPTLILNKIIKAQ